MKKTRLITLVLLSVIILFALGTTVWAASDTTTQLTHNINNDDEPQINSGGQVAWEYWNGIAYDIFLYTPDSGITQLTNNDQDNSNYERAPKINDNGQVVWSSYDGTDSEIFLYTPGSGTTQLTNNSRNDWFPQINGSGHVVWQGYDSDAEIFLYTPGYGITQLSSNYWPEGDPQLNSSGQVVWWDSYGIRLYTPGSGTVLLPNSSGGAKPQINDSGQIVWVKNDGHDGEIYLYTPGSGITQITNNTFNDWNSYMNNSGQLVWEGFGPSGTDEEIFLYTPGSGITQITDNDYIDRLYVGHDHINSNGDVVWYGWDGSDNEIFLYRGGTGGAAGAVYTITCNSTDDVDPYINDSGQLAWVGTDLTDSDYEIFLDTGQPRKPALYLSHESFWTSYAEYTARLVSVNLTVSNHGPGTANGVAITGAVNNLGVLLATPTPVPVGIIAEGTSASVTVKYHLPEGVSIAQFQTNVTGRASDGCGVGYTYPPED